MYSRLVVPLLCAAAIVFACGPHPRSTVTPTPPGARLLGVAGLDGRPALAPPPAVPTRHRRGRDTTSVDASLGVARTDDGVRLALQVVNQSPRRLEIDFPNGQTRDFVIYDAAGREVWRWSRGRLFTQAVQNKFLAAGDTVVYEERWDSASPGEYTAVATLRSRNFPVERRVTFQVHPASANVASVALH
jgi:Intracellular proteinase inhibitor